MARTKAFNEEEILNKAIELFWKQGFHATSMQDLVDHLGINRASLYATFGNKERLFKRALSDYQRMNQKSIKGFLLGYESVEAGLRAMFENGISATLNDPDRKGCFVVNTITELAAQDQDIKNLAGANQESFLDILMGFIQRGVDQGEIPQDKDVQGLAMLFFSLYNGFNVIGKVTSDRKAFRAALDAALKALR